ncbi:MAG: TolB family protein [Armatimonadota bacterium]
MSELVDKALRVLVWLLISVILLAILFAGLLIVLCPPLLLRLLPVSPCPEEHREISFDISPDGEKIVFTAAGKGCRDLYLLDLRTYKVRVLSETGALEADPRFLPDGQNIVYSARLESQNPKGPWYLFVRSVDGKTVRQLTRDPGVWVEDRDPKPVPGVNRIVFTRWHRLVRGSLGGFARTDPAEYVINLDGTGLRRLPRPFILDISPDGKKVLVVGEMVIDPNWQGRSILLGIISAPWVVEKHPPKPQLIKIGPYSAALWSPDGREIAFISDRAKAFAYEVWLTDIEGKKIEQLTHMDTYTKCLRFSPKGDSLLFLAKVKDAGMVFELYEVNIKQRKVKRIADRRLFDDPLHWKPEGTK